MKRIIIAIGALLLGVSVNAQISLEHSYTVPQSEGERDLQIINLEISGYKYALIDKGANQVRLYNLNHSVWKTININVPSGYSSWYPAYISEKLVNSDNNVELFIDLGGNPNAAGKVLLINENGNVLTTIDSASIGSEIPEVQTVGNSTYKLVLKCGKDKWCVYNLPGTIPCDKCGNGLGVGKPGKGITSGNVGNPAPNPSKAQTTVEYTLPIGATSGIIDVYNINGQKVKTYKVDNTFSSLLIDNSELNSGTYYYYLTSNGERSETKKMVVIK